MRQITLLLPVIFLLFSCKTVKEVVKTEVRYDSTAIEQNEALQRTLQETIENYEKERETWEKTGIIFETGPCDSIKPETVTKIIYDNGKLKSIQGRVKSLNVDLGERTTELYDAHRIIDSMGVELEKKEVELSKKETVKVLNKKITVWPLWLFALCSLAGMVLEWRFKLLKRLLSIFKL